MLELQDYLNFSAKINAEAMEKEFLCLLEQGCVPCPWIPLLATVRHGWGNGQAESVDQRLLTSPNQLCPPTGVTLPKTADSATASSAQLPKSEP